MNCTTFPPHVVTFDCRMSTLHSSKVAKVFKTSPWLLVDNTLTTAWFPKFSTSTCKCCPQILMSYHPTIPLVQVFGDHGTTMIKTLQILKDFMPEKEPCKHNSYKIPLHLPSCDVMCGGRIDRMYSYSSQFHWNGC